MVKRMDHGLSYTNEIYFKDGSGKEITSPRYHFSGDTLFFLKKSNFISTPTVMIRKNVLAKQRFDESLNGHEDWDLYLRLAYEGVKFLYINQPLTKIRIRNDSATYNTDIMDKSRGEVGLKARALWKRLKKRMNPFTLDGVKAIIRYAKLRILAMCIGFPWHTRFNTKVPHELL